VLTWEPPARFAMSWYPGHDDARATRLEVRFSAEGDGTRVDLEHTGWEILAAEGAEYAKNYDEGWGTVLGYYTRHFEE
jgi:uncharacterized protein YndB with AHSA1/START domain